MKQILLSFVIISLFQIASFAYEYSESYVAVGSAASDALELYDYTAGLSYLGPCIQRYENPNQGYYNCICACNDKDAILVVRKINNILSKHPEWGNKPVNVDYGNSTRIINPVAYRNIVNYVRPCLYK